eukprot:RCo039191
MGAAPSRDASQWARSFPSLAELATEVVVNSATRPSTLALLHAALVEDPDFRAQFKEQIFDLVDLYEPATGVHYFFKVVFEYSVETLLFEAKLKVAQLAAFLLQDNPQLENCAEVLVASGVTAALVEFLALLLHGSGSELAQFGTAGQAAPLEVALVLVKFFSYYRSFADAFVASSGTTLLLDVLVAPNLTNERRFDAVVAIELLTQWLPGGLALACPPAAVPVLCHGLRSEDPSLRVSTANVVATLLLLHTQGRGGPGGGPAIAARGSS